MVRPSRGAEQTLTEEELRGLIEQAHQIQILTEHPGWPVFVDWLHHRAEPHQRRVLNGGYKNLEDYREGVGFIKGVQVALQAAADTQQLVRTERDNGA